MSRVILEIKANLATIRLGSDEEPGLVILNRERLESFRDAIREVAKDSSLSALVVIGSSRGFCAGADIKLIESFVEQDEAEKMAAAGQAIFDELEALKIPSIAAISGACVGGGCELALSCDYRIGTPESKIGLPEIKLGVLPGFGGTQRLPRLVGVPQALDIILAGKTVNAEKAAKIGLFELIVSDIKELERCAADIVLGRKVLPKRKLKFTDNLLTNTAIGRKIAEITARKKTLASTKGHYPAPIKALESVFYGLTNGQKRGMVKEAALFGELAITEESKSLVYLYFLTQWAGKLGKVAKNDVKGAKVSLIGAGTMGAGIAGSFLSKKFPVSVVEPIEQVQERAKAQISKFIGKRRSDSERDEILKRLEIGSKFAALKDSKIVIEAIIEDVETKQEVFQKIAGEVSSDCILASNTSSLSLDEIAEGVPGRDRVIGMHFFNPAEKMPLVEIVRGKETSEKAIVYTAALTSALGKFPVVVENVPGFLVNRILTPYLSEAAHLLSEGYSIEDIDKAATSFGMPMGPIRLLDEIGLPVAAKVSEVLSAAYGERMEGPKYAEVLVAKGRFGKKSGLGFYKHEGKKATVDSSVYGFLGLSSSTRKDAKRSYLTDRLILAMVNEAIRAHDEGVAGVPGEDAAKQIDLASVMGMGFAPFRGGIMRYAEHRGYGEIAEVLDGFGVERLRACGGVKG